MGGRGGALGGDARRPGQLVSRATRTTGAASQGTAHYDWAASRYSAAELARARHPHELVASPDTVYWRLDVEGGGRVGTGACGPGMADKYQGQVPGRGVWVSA
jgi:hypothetical protein